MKKLIFTATLILTTLTFAHSQNLSEPKGGGVLDIVLVSPGDNYSTMNFEGQITGYGTVFVKFKVSAVNNSKTSGTLDGQGRTILNDGTLLSTPLKGTWRRDGEMLKFYFTDAVSNGATNFVIWDVNILEKKAEVKYYELHSASN